MNGYLLPLDLYQVVECGVRLLHANDEDEIQPDDMNGNLLQLDLCQEHECGVRLLYEDEIHRFDFMDCDGLEATQRFHLIMLDSSAFCPPDLDELEGRFQAKRARLEANKLEDFSVMRRIFEFLVDSLPTFIFYSEELYHEIPIGTCSFYLLGDVTPEWFSHQRWGSTVTFQLSSQWANSKSFLGFCLCAVIAFCSFSHSLQVKCTYHFRNYFRNEHGDSYDVYCYLHGWYDEKRIDSAHIFVGFDPCLVAKEDDIFNEYSEVSVEFQPEDMNGNLLPLDLCQVVECGVCLLDTDEMHRFGWFKEIFRFERTIRFYPLDRDELKAMFQAKRERFQGIRWEDYFVRRWIVMDNYRELLAV
uniref:C-JID domain-containing protein n=1 Tax=Populus davidiana TaxID=266767 RepID=A0A6M2EKB8_9ROSI